MQNDGDNQTVHAARELLSSGFRGVLATHSIECTGYPFGSLLTYSLYRDGWPLILISHLAKHTRNLTKDPRCSLTIVESGPAETQTLTRLNCLADAVPMENIDPQAAERHFRYFPENRGYYHELNFHFYRLKPVRCYCVSGFGAARWIGSDRLQSSNPFEYQEEEQVLIEINDRFRNRLLRRLAEKIDLDSTFQIIGVDATGLDLRQNHSLFRLPLPARVNHRAELFSLLADWL